ncbi:DUF500-domain-containing protein [Cystobasidium minutum MCA 4210]|uniref:DUF500-domain-containing protein n=1 Tax=Cystobasidium minutum MCA 4210 TaxID=1397322 RepID=UPI0034CEC7F9|eukprot:jgi/Rhomi1/21304/CE21303_2140
MPVQSPMPTNLPRECAKATQIFNSFASIIPPEILRGAKGFAILTIAKAGFLFSARAGTGLVIVKLPNGAWSAPSAVGTGGLGVGGQAGAELSEFVIILNSRAAVQSFMSNGSINLGGNLSVAVGPIGRNAEASGSINKLATMYSYSRTRGLFGGASLEGSVIFERNDSNTKAYRDYMDDYPGEVNARMLLSGALEAPPWAQGLINAIERHAGTLFDATWVDDQPSDHEERRNRGYSFGSEFAAQSSAHNSPTSSKLKKGQRGHSYSGSSARDPGAADEDEYGDAYDERTTRSPPDLQGVTSSKDRMAIMANQYKGRLRGYSLGSFGKKNNSSGGSGSSTPTRKNARDRSHSTATPRTRYDIDEDNYVDDEYNDYRTTGPQYPSRRRGFSDAQDGAQPSSPGGSSALAKSGSKFTEFMKRPVMPTRKSTSSVQTMSKSAGANSSSSRWKPGTSSKKEKNRLQYSGRYDSDEDRYGRDDFGGGPARNGNGRKNSAGASVDSPFGDQFNQVEHRFSSEHEDEDGVYGYRGSAAATGNSQTKTSRFMPSLPRPANKRSSTAPVQTGGYRPYHDDNGSDGEDDYNDVLQYTGNGRQSSDSRPAKNSVYGFSERFDENTARASFDSLDQPPAIAVFKHTVAESDNPFDEATSATTPSSSRRDNGGQFFTQQESKDLLSTLDEEIPLSSSYSDVERPTHRLDSRQFASRNSNGNSRTPRYDDHDNDNESIRSIDSSKEYMVVGQKAHKIPLKVREVDNDLMTSPTDMYKTNTALPASITAKKKEWRVATFDFEGGQPGDLSFKTGDVIEVLAKGDPDWWTGRIGLEEGIIPVNRTQPHAG